MDSEYCPPSLGLTGHPSCLPPATLHLFPRMPFSQVPVIKELWECRLLHSSLTAHPQALVLWPFVRVSDTHTGSGQGIHITQPVIPPPGQTEANSSLGLLGQAKCCGKVAGNWKRPECVPGSITGGLGKWLLLPESYFLFVVSASSLLALWAGDGDPLQRCHQEPSDTVFTWPSLGPFLLRNSPMLLGFLPVLPQ